MSTPDDEKQFLDDLAAMNANADRAARPPLPEASLRELLPKQFLDAHAGTRALRQRTGEPDPFGYDPTVEARLEPLLGFLYERYFRVEASGLDNLPASGRVLLVANHAGTLPLDGPMLRRALLREAPSPRPMRWLVEDPLFHLPFFGTMANRLGAVRACQENAELLLAQDEAVAVFPEGIKGIGKLYRDRYALQRFGRGGFVKLALRTGTPILPVAIVGGEETNPLLFRVNAFARRLGVPYIPVTPTFPLLGPVGLLPAPTKWQIEVGAPLDLGGHGADDADDEIAVAELTEKSRGTIQAMLQRLLAARRSVFKG